MSLVSKQKDKNTTLKANKPNIKKPQLTTTKKTD